MRKLNFEEIKIISSLGEKMRSERKSLGFTVEDVSKMTGLSQQLIYHFEHGRANNCVVYLELRVFYTMCRFYNISKENVQYGIEERFRRWFEDEIY